MAEKLSLPFSPVPPTIVSQKQMPKIVPLLKIAKLIQYTREAALVVLTTGRKCTEIFKFIGGLYSISTSPKSSPLVGDLIDVDVSFHFPAGLSLRISTVLCFSFALLTTHRSHYNYFLPSLPTHSLSKVWGSKINRVIIS